jgi:hypothetical protein
MFRERNYDMSTTGLNNCRMRRVSRVLSNMCLPSDYKGNQHQDSSANKMQSSKNGNQSGHGVVAKPHLSRGATGTSTHQFVAYTPSSPQVDLQTK